MSQDRRDITKPHRGQVDAFLDRLAKTPVVRPAGARGRLIFAMDATASREPTWDRACHIQSRMFEETAELGGLEVQLCWYRGFGEFHAGSWVRDPRRLAREMTGVRCLGGLTQIGRVLRHASQEAGRKRVHALVFVGDCVEEDADPLCHLAGELGVRSVPAFVFQEGHDPVAERVLSQVASLSGGAWCRFDAASPDQLRSLLGAVAVFAAGGRPALEHHARDRGGQAQHLLEQLGRK
jgi:hypothetical protein